MNKYILDVQIPVDLTEAMNSENIKGVMFAIGAKTTEEVPNKFLQRAYDEIQAVLNSMGYEGIQGKVLPYLEKENTLDQEESQETEEEVKEVKKEDVPVKPAPQTEVTNEDGFFEGDFFEDDEDFEVAEDENKLTEKEEAYLDKIMDKLNDFIVNNDEVVTDIYFSNKNEEKVMKLMKEVVKAAGLSEEVQIHFRGFKDDSALMLIKAKDVFGKTVRKLITD